MYALPHEEEWEKAARGVDGRVYPWGDLSDGTFSNSSGSLKEGMRIKEPGSFPVDESVYGILDLGGNMITWCLNAPEKKYRNYRCLRGGAWHNAPGSARGADRLGHDPAYVARRNGFRLVVRSKAAEMSPR